MYIRRKWKNMRDKTKIVPYEEQNISIYAYSLPQVSDHDGCIKVGETTREVEKRINEQLGTAGLIPNIHFTRKAQKRNGEWFHDKELHKYFILNNIPKKDFGTGADEWFYFNGTPEKAEELTDKFIALDYDEIQISENKSEYRLRREQADAVDKTVAYYMNDDNEREFLWNAKPRFGKTLTTYDFIRKISARQILIVTNRPAIANSWFDDFKKFISWQEPKMKFVSDSKVLTGKALTRDDYVNVLSYSENKDLECIYFVSLQDLKGSKTFGGSFDKYEWISKLEWDVLIIDEAHEGVDTYKTDKAFSNIKRKFTLHLSGTPFKAIANQKFTENQIYNWSYIDEQKAKENWDVCVGANPYANLPTLNMFTYQMSKLIRNKVELGYEFEDSNVDFAFDLAEFFKVENDKFTYENDVLCFLDNLASNKFPFSIDEHRDELKHTLWLLDRVASAKALEKLLKKHPVFKHYKVILAAGDGRTFDEEATDDIVQERSLDRVRKAISKSERTITLSVGQLTTGVTIPEWTGVLMLTNIKSPALYFQAAFRAQNPYEYVDSDGRLMRKENAYVFDFAPERTLVLYDEFANNLITSGVNCSSGERKDNIRELLNFFPVISEDENGNLQEINAEEVLTIPVTLKFQEVVKRGFVSNLLFANISAIFSAPSELRKILEKIAPEKDGKQDKKREIPDDNPMLDDRGEVSILRKIVINESDDLFGDKIYSISRKIDIGLNIYSITSNDNMEEVRDITSSIMDGLKEGIEGVKDKFKLTVKQEKNFNDNLKDLLLNKVEKIVEDKNIKIKELNEEYAVKIQNTSTEEERANVDFELSNRISIIEECVRESIAGELQEAIFDRVEEQIIKVEEGKKKTVEDEVRDHLRGFARNIPSFLMAYGDETTTLANFEKNIDPDEFLNLTSITIDEFKKLRDGFSYVDEETGEEKNIPGLFDEVVFNASIAEFFEIKARLADYFTNDSEEDIFDYIPPQKTNQIFTPRRVVNMMLDSLEENVPGIFEDKNKKYVDLYIKSGLYLTEIAKRLFKGLEKAIPFEEERIKHIFEKQLYGFAPSNIIYNISKNFIFGEFDSIRRKNIVECDVVPIVEEGKLEDKIKEVWGEDMKFDVVIGNPPYQEKGGSGGNNDSPLYQYFVQESYNMNIPYISMIIPSRWFSAGRENLLGDFRKLMLTCSNVKEMHTFTNAATVFGDVEIKGGVCYFIIDRNYEGKCLYKLDKKLPYYRSLDDFNILIRDNIVSEIVKKVYPHKDESVEKIMSSDTPFGIPSNPKISKKTPFKVYESVDMYDTKLYHIENKVRKVEYVNRDEIRKNKEFIDYWKVFVPGSGGSGNDEMILGRPEIASPNSVCSQSYLFSSHDTKEEAENFYKYIHTKFLRIIVSSIKITQSAPKRVYQFVPIQDFTSNSDIDWSKSIEEIDEQLFDKYGLTEEEREHIKTSIKEM